MLSYIRPQWQEARAFSGNDAYVRILGGSLFALEMAGTVVVLQLISLFFCCGKFPGTGRTA